MFNSNIHNFKSNNTTVPKYIFTKMDSFFQLNEIDKNFKYKGKEEGLGDLVADFIEKSGLEYELSNQPGANIVFFKIFTWGLSNQNNYDPIELDTIVLEYDKKWNPLKFYSSKSNKNFETPLELFNYLVTKYKKYTKVDVSDILKKMNEGVDDQYWYIPSEAIEIIEKILKLTKINYKINKIKDVDTEDKDESDIRATIDGLNEDGELFTVHILYEHEEIESDWDESSKTIWNIMVHLSIEGSNDDGIILENGKDFYNELVKNKLFDPLVWTKQLN